jgi:hypothetical protein
MKDKSELPTSKEIKKSKDAVKKMFKGVKMKRNWRGKI